MIGVGAWLWTAAQTVFQSIVIPKPRADSTLVKADSTQYRADTV